MKKILSLSGRKVYLGLSIIITVIILMYFVVYPLAIFLIPNLGESIGKITSPDKYKPREYIIVGAYNDKFLVRQTLQKSFPDLYYDFDLYEQSNDTIGNLIMKVESSKSLGEIRGIYNSTEIRCYLISYFAVYSENNSNFKSLSLYELPLRPEEYKFLLPAIRNLFKDNWEWTNITSDFLLKLNDNETKDILKKHSQGYFGDDEILKNRNSKYSKDDIQKISNEILKKYNIT